MTRHTDPRGANRRGSGWGDDIGYSAERTTTTHSPRYVPQETRPTVPVRWHTVRLDTGECVQVLPLWGIMPQVVDWGGRMRQVVEVIDVSPEFAPVTVEELEY